jgi:hypothetical protein
MLSYFRFYNQLYLVYVYNVFGICILVVFGVCMHIQHIDNLLNVIF